MADGTGGIWVESAILCRNIIKPFSLEISTNFFVYPQIFRPSKGTTNIMRSACVPLVKKGLDSKWIDGMEWRQGRFRYDLNSNYDLRAGLL